MFAPDENQALADLLWAINSLSLIEDPIAVPSLSLQDIQPVDTTKLVEFLARRQRGNQVGRYFENLVAFWLKHVKNFDEFETGIQIRQQGRTLGEIDFLFRDQQGVLNHWEAAVKFFLHFPNSSGSHFPGPNATDNFEAKIEKLFQSQLTISIDHFPQVQQRRALVRGTIFYHPHQLAPKTLPDRLAENHQRGIWIRCSELKLLKTIFEHSTCGHICSKPYWLAPKIDAKVKPIDELQAELAIHFQQRGYPVMVCMMNTVKATPSTLTEGQRLFVVGDKWPN